jgi:hypothetical protein
MLSCRPSSPPGYSLSWRHLLSCGRRGVSSRAAGLRWSAATSTCSRSFRWAPARPISTASRPPSSLAPSRLVSGQWAEPFLSITRRPRSSRCWSCSARCWNCGRVTKPAALSVPCSTSRRRARDACAMAATTKKSRWTRLKSGTGCASARGTAFPWMRGAGRQKRCGRVDGHG